MHQSGPLDSFEQTIPCFNRFKSLLSSAYLRRVDSILWRFMAFSLTALVGYFICDAFDDSRYC
jgi:hypothetical protein